MNEIILIRHYIFINPFNVYENINENDTLKEIKKIHSLNYTNHEILNYYGYMDIITLLNEYEVELCELFKKINHKYSALLADIGRLIILFVYGGIYHDLKCMSNIKIIDYLKNVSSDVEIICEEHPFHKNRVRNTNIVVLKKNVNFLNIVLRKMKKKLFEYKNEHGPDKVFEIGSGIFINEFLNDKIINKYPFQNDEMLKLDNFIYSKNLIKWQEVYECIFY